MRTWPGCPYRNRLHWEFGANFANSMILDTDSRVDRDRFDLDMEEENKLNQPLLEHNQRIKEQAESFLLVSVCTENESKTQLLLDELEELLHTAGGQSVGRITQKQDAPNTASYLGRGKIEEIRGYLEMTGADGIICDDELTPAQMRNLAMALDCKVMDRTILILDIFASHAASAEGKIQVELAQLRYRATHLTGMGLSMSRLGGGIGTRGPGESRLEIDRRRIRSRIGRLKAMSQEAAAHRQLTREHRKRQQMPVAAIVGYTNAGKSTLLNALTGAGVLAQDVLFATLDTTTRIVDLGGSETMLLTDTVGFIRKLPHGLIDAFRSTLEEAKYADYIIQLVDASDPDMEERMHVVRQTLDELGVKNKKILTLFNKCDRLEEDLSLHDFRADKSLCISARTGMGLHEVRQALADFLREDRVLVERVLDYQKMQLLARIHERGQVLEESYEEDGIHIKAYVPLAVYGILDD